MKRFSLTRSHLSAAALIAAAGFAFGPMGPVPAPSADAGPSAHRKFSGKSSFGNRFHGRSFGRHGFSRRGNGFFNRGFRSRTFFGGFRSHGGVGFDRGFDRGFGGHSSTGLVYTPRRSTVYVDRPQTVVVPARPDLTAPAYPSVQSRDAWGLLESGRFALAQNAFAQIATQNPARPDPKVGYGLSAIFNGSYDLGEMAFLRANAVDPGVWERLEKQPAVRAAATDLSKDPNVQQSEVLREATRRLAGPPADAYPTAGSAPADAGKPADHDYPTTGN